jgi:GxxExxY protein
VAVNGSVPAVQQLTEGHEAQFLNYLEATTIEVGLLLNFGPELGAYASTRKGSLAWAL